jgi:hypothetical protein
LPRNISRREEYSKYIKNFFSLTYEFKNIPNSVGLVEMYAAEAG